MATSFHGTPRSTNDADLVADLRLAHVPLLAAALEAELYLDRIRMSDAVRRRSSFNLIYLETMFKVDVFVAAAIPANPSAASPAIDPMSRSGGS